MIIREFNKVNPGIELKYSTPTKYVEEVKKMPKKNMLVHRDDAFPYSLNQDQFWSGFYSTRPLFKSLERRTSNRFHSSLNLAAKEFLGND